MANSLGLASYGRLAEQAYRVLDNQILMRYCSGLRLRARRLKHFAALRNNTGSGGDRRSDGAVMGRPR